MARVIFISLYDRNAYGIRLMSALLKQNGHTCNIIFLKKYKTSRTFQVDSNAEAYPWIGIHKNGRPFKYASNSLISEKELSLLSQTIDKIQPDLVGITVNTPLRTHAKKVTLFLKKKFHFPVIWGGFDPTVNPYDCIKYCDYACIGEGESTILAIASQIDSGNSLKTIGNLCFLENGISTVNQCYPLDQNLDKIPWRDNSPEGKFLIEDDRLIENEVGLNDKKGKIYQVMSSRGCPNSCSYCCEASFKKLYGGERFLRRRSPDDVVNELAEVKKKFNIEAVQFEDEIFSVNVKWLESFVPLYNKNVDLPFTAYLYPSNNIPRSLKLLKEAGLNYCCLSLQSGSERINRNIFERPFSKKLFLKTAHLCRELEIPFYTDIITYNPCEDEKDLKETLNVLVQINGAFNIAVNKLFILPNTRISQIFQQNNIALELVKQNELLFNYYSRLFWIAALANRPARLVSIIEKFKIFRKYPKYLNPQIIEFGLHPILSSSSALFSILPEEVKYSRKVVRLKRTLKKYLG
ncbi:MAG: radical SAM protein [Candidatus Electrothrix sp. LOE1_4_5]|nr:radical SAM protein [Candidatus Electrothrix gigas]